MSLSPSALSPTALIAGPAINPGREAGQASKRGGLGAPHRASKPNDDSNATDGPEPALGVAQAQSRPRHDTASKVRPFAAIWSSTIERGEPASSAKDAESSSTPGSEKAAAGHSGPAGKDASARMRLALAGITAGSAARLTGVPADGRLTAGSAPEVQSAITAGGANKTATAGLVSQKDEPQPSKGAASAELASALAGAVAASTGTEETVVKSAEPAEPSETRERSKPPGESSLERLASAAGPNLDTLSKAVTSSVEHDQKPEHRRLAAVPDPSSPVPEAVVPATAPERAPSSQGSTAPLTPNKANQGTAAASQQHTPSTPHGSTPMFLVDAAAAREAIGRAPNSEIAFEVELHATDKNIDSSQPKGQPVSQTVLVPETGGPGAANAPAAEPFAQRPGTEAPNSHASEPGADAGIRLGRSEGTAAADTGSPSDQNDGFNSGPGARQPALAFSHDTAAASPKLTAEAGRAQQQPSTPAAQLESHFSDPSVANQQPARSLSMKIHSEEHGSANVILTDRAGQVHVTVRAADPSLTQSLRSELNSLAGGLEQQGFAVRVWHPSSGSSMDGDRRGHSAGSAPDDLSGQPQQGQQHGDAGRRNRPQPEWMEELD